MAMQHSQVSRSTAPHQVWAELTPDSQHHAVQLLAQMALNFLTAQALTAQKEEREARALAASPPTDTRREAYHVTA